MKQAVGFFKPANSLLEKSVYLTNQEVCLTAELRVVTFSQIPIFHIASFSLDTKQQVLIQYHPAVYFN